MARGWRDSRFDVMSCQHRSRVDCDAMPLYQAQSPWRSHRVRLSLCYPAARHPPRLRPGGANPAHGTTIHMSDEDLKAELERLKAENERLKSQRGRSVGLKVSEKGGVSVYGLGRFPVTLYKEQWTKLLSMADEIRAFIKENDAKLKAKPEG